MKNLLTTICLMALIGTAIGVNVGAAGDVDVNATVTITALSIASITPTTFDYGSLGTSDTKTYLTTSGAQTYGIKVENGGTAADFKIKGSATTGGTTAWTLDETTPGANIYVHRYAINSGGEGSPSFGSYTGLTGSNKALASSVIAGGFAYFSLELKTPTVSADVGIEKTLPVTVMAVAPAL